LNIPQNERGVEGRGRHCGTGGAETRTSRTGGLRGQSTVGIDGDGSEIGDYEMEPARIPKRSEYLEKIRFHSTQQPQVAFRPMGGFPYEGRLGPLNIKEGGDHPLEESG